MERNPELTITELPVDELVPYAGNAKLHPGEQVAEIAASISEFGNCDPIAVWTNADGRPEIVEGHGRLLALKKLGIETAPVIFLDHLTDEQRRAYAHVHNQTTLSSGFDVDALAVDMADLPCFDWSSFGFDDVSIDGFGTDFMLDNADAPHYRHVALELTQEQFELLMNTTKSMCRDDCIMRGGNEMGDKVSEVIRQWTVYETSR